MTEQIEPADRGDFAESVGHKTLPKVWYALIALSLGFFMTLIDQSAVPLALPSMSKALGDVSISLWVSSAYLLAVVSPLPATGRLGDRFGHKQMTLLGVTLFTVGATLAGFATTPAFLIGARLLQGFGASLMIPQAMAVLRRIFPSESFGTALGYWGIAGSLAGLTGPLLGGFLVSELSWRVVFFMQFPLGLLMFAAVVAWVPNLKRTTERIDTRAELLSIGALAALVFAIEQATLWLFPVAIVLGALAVWVAKRTGRFTAAGLTHNHNYVVGSVAISLMGVMAAAEFIPIMFWLQQTHGVSAALSGVLVTPMALVALFAGPACGKLADRRDPRLIHYVGFGIMAAAFALLIASLSSLGVWVVAVVTALLGLGQSFVWAANASVTLRGVSPEHAGIASGIYNTSRQLGSVIGTATVSAALVQRGPSLGLVVLFAVCVVGVAISSFLQPSESAVE